MKYIDAIMEYMALQDCVTVNQLRRPIAEANDLRLPSSVDGRKVSQVLQRLRKRGWVRNTGPRNEYWILAGIEPEIEVDKPPCFECVRLGEERTPPSVAQIRVHHAWAEPSTLWVCGECLEDITDKHKNVEILEMEVL